MLNLKERLIDILVKSKSISKERLDKLIQSQKKKNLPLRKLLVKEKIITEGELLSILSEHLFLPSLRLAKYKFDPKIIKLVPERFCRQYGIIPLSRIGNTLTVAMSDPMNIFALDDLKALTSCEVDIVLSPENEITAALDNQFRTDAADLQQVLGEVSLGSLQKETIQEVHIDEELELTEAVREGQTPPIVKLVDLMLIQALRRRSSDIHVEPEEDCLRIRYRIDGDLHDVLRLPKKNQNTVLGSICTLNLNELGVCEFLWCRELLIKLCP